MDIPPVDGSHRQYMALTNTWLEPKEHFSGLKYARFLPGMARLRNATCVQQERGQAERGQRACQLVARAWPSALAAVRCHTAGYKEI